MKLEHAQRVLGVVAFVGLEACASAATATKPRSVTSTIGALPETSTRPVAVDTAADDGLIEKLRERAEPLITSNCTHCHNETSLLDLRTSPPASDGATWKKIASNVKSGRMPPTSAESPFPLDHEVRAKLAAIAAAIGTAPRTAHPRAVIYPSMTWIGIVHEVADPFLGGPEVDRVVLRYRGGIGGLRDDADPSPTPVPMLAPLAQVNMNLISYGVCKKMVSIDESASADGRRLLRGGADGPPYDSVAIAFHQLIYGERPTAYDLTNERALLRSVHAQTGSLADAAVALCTAALAGPRIMVANADEKSVP
jgi:hypothetical protein